MGNTLSDTEDEAKADYSLNPGDDSSDKENDNEEDQRLLTDLSQLFGDSATLRAAATKVKEKIPENVILQNHAHILSWLEGHEGAEGTVTLAQFCDMMTNHGVERPDAIKAFHQFDCDGSGIADVETMLIALGSYSSRSALGELGKSIRILQSCSLTPGFVDVYTGNGQPMEKHGTRMLQYIVRNRVESNAMPFSNLSGFHNIQTMRSSILQASLLSQTLTDTGPETEIEGEELEKRLIENCYSQLEVSSNSAEVNLLRHPSLYWQSDGAARSHWVRIHVKPQVVIKELSIGVSSSDQSYMPDHISVCAGHSVNGLREIKDIKVQKHMSGQVTLLKHMKLHYPLIQINIKRCHGDGCDTRIHGIKMSGYRMIKDPGITVADTSAVWFLKMLTATVSHTMQLSPSLRVKLLSDTMTALQNIPPLSLSAASPERPSFINKHLLQEVNNFAALLVENNDSANKSIEDFQVPLALNLASGNVTGMIKIVTSLIALKESSLPCAVLLSKALATRFLCWDKVASPLTVKCLGSDGGRGPLNLGPEVVLESNPTANVTDGSSSMASRVYVTEEGKTSCTMLFRAEDDVQLSKIRIQVANGMKGPRHGLVFIYNPECVEGLSNKFDFDEHVKHFSKFDFWGATEFKFSIEYREAGLGGLPDNPVSFFRFEQDWDELEIPVKWKAFGRYIMVKFLDPRYAVATRLGIVSIKLFGLPRPSPWYRDTEKLVAVANNPEKPLCSSPKIVLVILTFITDIAVDQLKRRNRSWKPAVDFLDLSDLDVMTLWNLHLLCSDCQKQAAENGEPQKNVERWQEASLQAIQLIHGLIPILASSKTTTQASRDSLFEQLCQYINQEGKKEQEVETAGTSTSKPASNHKLKMIQQIIIDGAALFFPEKTKKRNELFKLLQNISDQSSQPSTSLVFQSLCQFFSTVDPKGLLELPSNPEKLPHDFDPINVLDMMKSLLLVASQETNKFLLTETPKPKKKPEAAKTKNQSVKDTSGKDTSGITAKDLEDLHKEFAAVSNVAKITKDDDHVASGAEANSGSTSASASGAAVTDSSLPGENLVCDDTKDKGESNSVGERDTNKMDKQEASDEESSQELSSDEVPSDQQGMTYLIKLTTSLQAALMVWCWQQLDQLNTQDNEELVQVVNLIVLSYTQQLMENASRCLEVLKEISKEQLERKAQLNEPSFLCSVVRQQCMFLLSMVDKVNIETKVKILESCKKFLILAGMIAEAYPELFSDLSHDKEVPAMVEETILRTWEVESPHEYHNHSNINQMFHCPGASKFLIDFDPRCETERRYDYLEFVDAKGLKMRFDHKVGNSKWPKQVTFSGPHLSFQFHSDSSNTEWGYKFTVTAKGSPDVAFSWLMDLHYGLIKVLGRLCGATLGSNPVLPLEVLKTTNNKDDSGEQDILRSDLWTSLFRGGYRVEGKLQRSLSGRFATGDDSEIHSFLLEVLHQTSDTKDKDLTDPEGTLKMQVARFLTKCKESDPSKAQIKMGGSQVNKALMSVFVALVWHCQQLREDVDKFLQAGVHGEISEGIVKAYTMAESVRIQLASQRQRWNTQDDKDEEQDPAELLSSKCVFLLKFAGLTKVQLKNELRSKYYKQMMMKKAGNKPVVRNEVLDKYPSFRLVMEFVQDPAWTSQRVHQLLQERTKFASAIRDVYLYAAEAVRILSDGNLFQVPVVLFLQEMFGYQEKFAAHYADGLDGCGLEQESQVRQAYYTLVRILVDAFKKRKVFGKDSPSFLMSAHDIVQCCLLHLLDIEWLPYDLSFVSEMGLPQLYFKIAKETVKMRDLNESDQKDEEELKDYEQTMKWYSEVTLGLGDWFRKKEEETKDDKKAMKMFIARFSDVLDVEISCDGCSVTLPGRRYRCLQCLDMDLCTACFSGGVEPEEHRDDHEIVHLVYKCNHCQAFIMGKRIHCNQCDDFDLCLGCHTKEKFPVGHTKEHSVTVFPMVKLKTSQSSNSLLRAYIHQHAWLLYTSLTLTLSDLVYGQNNGYSFLDHDYIRIAGQLQSRCIISATQCLQHNIDVEKEKDLPEEKRMEESFARHSQERIMGLLGAVMPMQEKRDVMSGSGFNFWTQDFLDLLLQVSKGEHSHELNTQHQALRLMGRLLLTTELPSSSTPTTPLSNPLDPVPSTVNQDKQLMAGKETIGHLFTYGAKEFEKHGLEWACSVARMLEMLFASSHWRPMINDHVSQCMHNLQQKVDLACIFPMFVIAGFPEVLTTGTLVEYNDTSVDKQKGVVLKHFPDKYQTLVVNLKTRKRHTIKDQYVSCYSDKTDSMWEPGCLGKFINYVILTVGKIRTGEELSVEILWALSLALKVLDRCLKDSQEMDSVGEEVSSSAFIQSLVFLACKGTSLNHHWLLRDLEVLSLIWYTQDGNLSKKRKMGNLKDKKDGKKRRRGRNDSKQDDVDSHLAMAMLDDDDDDDDKDDDYKKAKDSDDGFSLSFDDDDDDDSDSDSDNDSLWETTSTSEPDDDKDEDDNDDDDDDDDDKENTKSDKKDTDHLWVSVMEGDGFKDLFDELHKKLEFDPETLVELYRSSDGGKDVIINTLIEHGDVRVTDIIDKWKNRLSLEEGKKEKGSETSSIDTGISVHSMMGTQHKIPDVAEKEKGFNMQNLFTQQDKLEGAIKKKQRAWSSTLFRKELEKHGRSGSREYLLKFNLAMCILYARHTLTGLLAQWPATGPAINSSLLGCKDVKQIPCVLDLLHKIDSRDFFSKVVDKVIHLCDESSLVAIAYTAAQFMEEVTLSAETRESSHNYTDSDSKKGHITLPGASYLTITFDSRCATGEDDSLTFSTRQQMDKDTHTFCGLSRDCWTAFHLPGDTLYYKFYLDDYDTDESYPWGYRFTVTAGTRDSFETGHTILEAVLSSAIARSLPLGQLWNSLVYVSVKQAGVQRLKAVHLMLKVLALQHKADQTDQTKTTPDIDLCLLRPLWELYESLNNEAVDTNVLQPAAIGALTDLFLQVEELASEWGLSQDYLVSLISRNHLQMAVVQAVKNVATVGHEIGWPTAISEVMTGPKVTALAKAICGAMSGKKSQQTSAKS